MSPAATEPPSVTASSLTLPARWAVISFSIFIASTTQMRVPSSTSSPFFTGTFSTVPWIGETSVGRAGRGSTARRRAPAAGGGRRGRAECPGWPARRADHLHAVEAAVDLDLVGPDLGRLGLASLSRP